jgi:hypothetical protein
MVTERSMTLTVGEGCRSLPGVVAKRLKGARDG